MPAASPPSTTTSYVYSIGRVLRDWWRVGGKRADAKNCTRVEPKLAGAGKRGGGAGRRRSMQQVHLVFTLADVKVAGAFHNVRQPEVTHLDGGWVILVCQHHTARLKIYHSHFLITPLV